MDTIKWKDAFFGKPKNEDEKRIITANFLLGFVCAGLISVGMYIMTVE